MLTNLYGRTDYAADANKGVIYSKKGNNLKMLKPRYAKGYQTVRLYKEGTSRNYLIHRLIWETVNGPIPENMTVDHIDANKDNNSILNLQLLSRADNTRKANKGNTYWLGKKHSIKTKAKLCKAGKSRNIKRDEYGRFAKGNKNP
jgi:hypothetical protein